MQAYLMNFGANTRVVNDSNNMPLSIGVGELKECDIHDVHYHMIKRGVAKETLLVVPKEVKKTERLVAIMDLLKVIETDSLDTVTKAFHEIVPADETGTLVARPTRGQMRMALMHHARREVAAVLRLQSQVFIREEQTPNTPKQPPEPRKDNADGALETMVPDVKKHKGPEPIKKKAAATSSKGKSKSSKPPKAAPKTARKRERL